MSKNGLHIALLLAQTEWPNAKWEDIKPPMQKSLLQWAQRAIAAGLVIKETTTEPTYIYITGTRFRCTPEPIAAREKEKGEK
jgi:hypothetical protein